MKWEEKQVTAEVNIPQIDISQEEIDFIEAYIKFRLEAVIKASLVQDIKPLVYGQTDRGSIGILERCLYHETRMSILRR